jgi:hypothetical protein
MSTTIYKTSSYRAGQNKGTILLGEAGGGAVMYNPTDFQMSVIKATYVDVVTLVNDESSPGILKYYGTDASGVKGWYSLLITELEYGLLYNWHAVNDSKNIANTGWHVLTEDDADDLLTELGGASIAGGKLKETGYTYWDSPNTGATNEVGFNARGSGVADTMFQSLREKGSFIFSDEIQEDTIIVNATAATGIYTTIFTANWIARNPEIIGFRLDVSTSPTFSSFVSGYNDLDVGYVFNYDIIGLSTYTTYYYRVRGITATGQTANSNTRTLRTYFILTLISRGDGSGVMILTLNAGASTVLDLTGSARFYDDAAGTINPQNSVTISGLNTIYIKCPSGTASLILSDPTSFTRFESDCDLGNSSNIPSIGGDILAFSSLTILNFTYYQSNTFLPTTAGISRFLTYFLIYGIDMTGDVADLPETLEIFSVSVNHITGNIEDLPPNIVQFYFQQIGDLSGALEDLPASMVHFSVYTSGIITGDFSDLKEGLKTFNCIGETTCTVGGDLSDLPSTLESITVKSLTSFTGSLANLPAGVNTINITSANTFSGSLSDLPSVISLFSVEGSNTIGGTLSSFPATLSFFNLRGNNTITGTLNDIPASCKFFIYQGGGVSGYTSGHVFASDMQDFIFIPTGINGLTSSQVDDLLIDLAATTWDVEIWSQVHLASLNEGRTSASDAAVAILEGMGLAVYTN